MPLGPVIRLVAPIVGGSKVSTKLDVLNRLAEIGDGLILGGGIANTFWQRPVIPSEKPIRAGFDSYGSGADG